MKYKITFVVLLFSVICQAQKNPDTKPKIPNAKPSFSHVKYGPGEFNYLNLYIAPSSSPTAVYIWGHANGPSKAVPNTAGGFKAFVWDSLRSNGISAISWESIQQITNAEEFLEAESDMFKVLDWVIEHASEYNIDTTKIFTGGRSRGTVVSWKASQDNRYANLIKGIYSVQFAGGGSRMINEFQTYIDAESPYLFLTFKTHLDDTTNIHSPEKAALLLQKYNEVGIGEKASLYHSLPDNYALYDSLVTFIHRTIR